MPRRARAKVDLSLSLSLSLSLPCLSKTRERERGSRRKRDRLQVAVSSIVAKGELIVSELMSLRYKKRFELVSFRQLFLFV